LFSDGFKEIKEFWHNSLEDYDISDDSIDEKLSEPEPDRISNERRLSDDDKKRNKENLRESPLRSMSDDDSERFFTIDLS